MGVDTSKDTHCAAVIGLNGHHLSAGHFPAAKAGYQALRAFINCQGELLRVGIVGINSYGAGLSRPFKPEILKSLKLFARSKLCAG